ncbi:LytR/AlgR family response regulator transcription factor [Clostridium chrysemydis]|uniref:LytR/AlgR family response regulator transcription factor n=1 Tax=Clostridium chrysemydis TaxID=2665504 RepID=UPI001883EB06|nr:LytTR family DNA-binding domain-containing protein [Clostridium chrysemydis]
MINISFIYSKEKLTKDIKEYIDESEFCKNEEYRYLDLEFLSEDLDTNLLFIKLRSREDIKNARKIRERLNNAIIVFVSENNEFVFECLSFKPIFFIRENKFKEDIFECLIEIDNYFKNKNKFLILKEGSSIIRINSLNILYIESFGHYLIIHSKGLEYKVRESILNIYKKLDMNKFIRVHKSFLVNREFVFKVEKNKLVLTNLDEVPIGRKYKEIEKTILIE